MNMYVKTTLLFFISFFILTVQCHGAEGQASTSQKQSQNITSDNQSHDVNALVAGLDDQQVRRLLIDELQKASDESNTANEPVGLMSSAGVLLQQFNEESGSQDKHLETFVAHIPDLLPDLKRVLLTLSTNGSFIGIFKNIGIILLILAIGGAIELIFRRYLRSRILSAPELQTSGLCNTDKFSATIIEEIPSMTGLLVFFAASYISYFSFIQPSASSMQLFFLASLLTIAIIRVVNIISNLIFSPSVLQFRILPIPCPTANIIHRTLVAILGYIIFAMMFANVAKNLGAGVYTVKLLLLVVALMLLISTAIAIFVFKNQISNYILSDHLQEDMQPSWIRQQFASVWHILAFLYLLTLAFLLANEMINPAAQKSGAFIFSFFAVPIWIVADRLVQIVVKHAMAILRIHQETYETPDADVPEEELMQREKGRALNQKVVVFTRGAFAFAMLIWVASLWDIQIPFFSNLTAVLFDSLIILTLALLLWQSISSWIERKINESTPDEDEEESDSEWGAAATRGRSYTLLPMIRKFIGTVLMVMVTMTILSSMGVDIGPLLAGAGVIGLAIGFGAQKLVADVFSGFFYLLDDAFRVGEYLKAGTVSGTVENISLRNIMLRHHRGMLQIIPHSELGAITNFMRGGIIVKFNLDFPYDANVDQIRKIIKKVGQAMLTDEEFGKDFIRPVKSQGVREITNSVMTIRVKFTANPGTHFVIRREAYRRITEALRAKGINYAHKRVIVDMPQSNGDNNDDAVKQIAGAAAQQATEVPPVPKG